MMTDKEMNTGKWITAAASLLAFMGIGVVDPLLPSIAESIGASHSQVEMLFTAYIFTMAIMMIPIGIVAGKMGDKKLIVIGLFIVTILLYYVVYLIQLVLYLFFELVGVLVTPCSWLPR